MRTKEQGSVVGYVLGAVVLLALLLGGITLYKNYAGKLAGSSDNQVTTQDKTMNGDDKTTQNEAALKQQQEEAEKKAQEQNQAANSSGSNGSAVTEVPHTATAPAQNLPATGPENVFMTAAGMAVIMGAAVAYIRSRSAL